MSWLRSWLDWSKHRFRGCTLGWTIYYSRGMGGLSLDPPKFFFFAKNRKIWPKNGIFLKFFCQRLRFSQICCKISWNFMTPLKFSLDLPPPPQDFWPGSCTGRTCFTRRRMYNSQTGRCSEMVVFWGKGPFKYCDTFSALFSPPPPPPPCDIFYQPLLVKLPVKIVMWHFC